MAAKSKTPTPAPAAAASLTVLRLPGAPPVRAGRAWPAGQRVRVAEGDLSPAQVLALLADPGYAVSIDLDSRPAEPTPSDPADAD